MGHKYFIAFLIGVTKVVYTLAACANVSETVYPDSKVSSNNIVETGKVNTNLFSECRDYCMTNLENSDCAISYILSNAGDPTGAGECSYWDTNCGGSCIMEYATPSSVTVYTCTGLNCATLTNPANGAVTAPGTPVTGDIATYTCNTGYQLIGSSSSTCGADGLWDTSAPTCSLIDCGGLGNPTNGLVDISSGTTYGQVATYSCNSGYVVNGASSRTCGSGGTWSSSPPTCVIEGCGALVDPVNGFVTMLQATAVGDVALYNCDIGYDISGFTSTTCGTNGSWDNPAPSCNPVDCGMPVVPSNGSVNAMYGTTYLQLATYSCDLGYILNGATTTTCGADGLWDTPAPSCDIIDCGAPPSGPVNGYKTVPGTTYTEVTTFYCDYGYLLTGPSTLICQADGTWNGTTPSCDPLDCGPLVAPANGSVATLLGTTFGMTAIYSCAYGFALQGDTTQTCQSNGIWSGSQPNCTNIPSRLYTCNVAIDCLIQT
ncbi:CUB and sushi domain-containing protein 3 [Mactra antiquata]